MERVLADMTEIVISEFLFQANGREIYGKLHHPADEGEYPAIIMSHGYNGSHDNFPHESLQLAKSGYVVCTYDFCGGSVNSKSSGRTEDMTIFSEMEDLRAVIDYVRSLEQVDANNLFLMGGSQGGLVTSLVAEEVEELIRGMILYFPAFNIPDDWRNHFKAEADIPEVFEFWGMNLGGDFFRSIREFDTFEHIGGLKKNVLVIHGDRDSIVTVENSERAKQLYQNMELVVLPGEGHGFSPAGTETATNLMLDFLKKSVVIKNENGE